MRPVGWIHESGEDHGWAAWVCERAQVVEVIDRGVRLRNRERERLYMRWALKDGKDLVTAEREFRQMMRAAGR